MRVQILERHIRAVDDAVERWQLQPREIKVTAEDIDQGRRRSCSQCPVALAIQREFPVTNVYVDGTMVHYEGLKHVTGILLPRNAREWILLADEQNQRLELRPFSFVTLIPTPVWREPMAC